MRANLWMGKGKVSVEHVPDPQILHARDAIVKVTATTICEDHPAQLTTLRCRNVRCRHAARRPACGRGAGKKSERRSCLQEVRVQVTENRH